MKNIKTIYRIITRPIYMFLFYFFQKKNINVSRNGQPLKMGISAVVAMKNEEYTLPFCLESLIGFADQVIIIDNGSEDTSLSLARKFKAEHGNKVEVDIIEMPGALLGDCREAGLKATRYHWHLRWDADMVAHNDGPNNIQSLRNKILKDSRPRTIQLPRINLCGDLFHTQHQKDWDEGEPILIWFNRHICYKEFGKFDTVRVPKYYTQLKEEKNYYFHCQGLKSDTNLIHRFHYFHWRENFNLYNDSNRPEGLQSYERFVDERNLFLFETSDWKKIKYRYQRQCVQDLVKFDKEKFGEYPKVLSSELLKGNQRFMIVYKDDDTFTRIDDLDDEMKNYVPDKDDENWSIDSFIVKISSENN